MLRNKVANVLTPHSKKLIAVSFGSIHWGVLLLQDVRGFPLPEPHSCPSQWPVRDEGGRDEEGMDHAPLEVALCRLNGQGGLCLPPPWPRTADTDAWQSSTWSKMALADSRHTKHRRSDSPTSTPSPDKTLGYSARHSLFLWRIDA